METLHQNCWEIPHTENTQSISASLEHSSLVSSMKKTLANRTDNIKKQELTARQSVRFMLVQIGYFKKS